MYKKVLFFFFSRRVGNIVTINAWSKAVQSLGTSNDYAHIGTLPESMQPKTSYLTYTFINNNFYFTFSYIL
ncbi:MAG: hypothetical protein SOT71_00245 [Romboutsia timonensis]|uniref:hypothetical protein n=1 Tax=Romboutsia timonensis TaxID=1776391 RepID=UPI002A75D2C2|nr:hypothetical protein [Romboutsia timonensis]MDY2881068.1 hypothetical protein [Romboutsia timonensis]